MKYQKGHGLAEVLVIALVLAGIGGWIANIVKLIASVDAAVGGMFVLRIIGVFAAPLGCILGWF